MKIDWRIIVSIIGLCIAVSLGAYNSSKSSYFAPVSESKAIDNAEIMDAVVKQAADKVLETSKEAILLEPSSGLLAEPGTFFGGIPTRFEGEQWPRNKKTGELLTFVFQITKNEYNKNYMGNIEVFRLFLDYESNMVNDPELGDVQILVADSKNTNIPSSWAQQTLDQLQSESPEWGWENQIYPKQNLKASTIVTGSNAVLENARQFVEVDNFELWWDLRVNAIKKLEQLKPELVFPSDRSVLGGNPYWVQYAEEQRFPFFIQLVPSDLLGIGDGGHVYIFLDKFNPTNDFGYSLQMY